MIKLYQFLSYVLCPIILINLYLRIIRNKEDRNRYKERFGKTDFNLNFSKKIIWLHAASVGEFKSSHVIIEKYHKDFQILVTTSTKTSADYVKKYYNKKVIHQYIPFDVPFWCNRFLNYWKPSLVLWIESDIWPNMLKNIRDKKIDCMYINARISPKSFNKWKYLKNLYSEALSTFNKIFVQSGNDLKRIEILTDAEVKYIGNLKLSYNNKNKINEYNDKKFSIMIASSHHLEEEMILSRIKKIIHRENLKVCIAPRHPERVKDISKLLEKNNFSYSLDSENKNSSNEIMIVDSFGNLDSYFKNSQIVILGGSFISKGGHNPLEPARYGCAIISGNYVYNWQNIYDEMLKEKACLIIKDIQDLEFKIENILFNKELFENFKNKALDFSNKKFFDDVTLFKEINFVLN